MAPTKTSTRVGFVTEVDLGTAEYDLLTLIDKGPSYFAIRGSVAVDGREFRLSYVDSDTAKVVVGVFETPDGKPLTIDLNRLAAGVSAEVGDLIPSIEVSISRAMFAVAKADRGSSTALIFGVEFGADIDLADLPLVGPKLAGGRAAKLDGLKVLATSTALDKNLLQAIRSALGRSKFTFADATVTSLPAGPMVSARLQMGDTIRRLTIPMAKPTPRAPKALPAGTPKATSSSTSSSTAVTPVPAGVVPTAKSGVEKGGGVRWINLNKTFGPVNVGRVGFKMGQGKLTLLVDAGMGLGPVSFGLAGLGVTNPLTKFDPEFHLDGLALAYESGPIKISGGLLYDKPNKAFVGTAQVKTPALSISALGGYQQLNGQESLFIYAVLDYPIGGPPFFFVTGLALGFGYNRTLLMPNAESVPNFPLVQAAMSGPSKPPLSPIAQLRELQRVVPARIGEMFFAIGIKFTSFKLIDSFALLVVRLGNELVIDLLGISRISAPPLAKTPVARAELAIRATLNLTKGTLLVRGVLTSNSFILSQKCRLSGGFAFAAWFADQSNNEAKAGDFVVTLGGYHPDFKAPSHYPSVPRVGLHWQVTRELSIKGGIYMALTPKMIMAGGSFSAVYARGKIRASFDMAAHFLISWQPYYYRARLSVRFRFSYRIRVDLGWFGTINKTLSFNVSASLKLWGPEFGGTARVSVSVVSFDVKFGASIAGPKAINWSQFQTSFLPSDSECLALTLTDGVLREQDDVAVVSGAEFRLELNAVVPVVDSRAPNTRRTFGVAPMDRGAITGSALTVTVTKNGKPFDDLVTEPVVKNGPAGMWGSSMTAGMGGQSMLDRLVMGYRFKPKAVKAPTSTTDRSVEEFAYDIKPRPDAFAPAAAPQLVDRARDANAVASNANTKTATTNRAAILASLGLDDSKVRLTDMAADPAQAFVSAPRSVG